MEDVVHHRLESHQGICEAKEHNHWLKQSLVCFEGGLPLIAVADVDVVISLMDIKLCKSTD
jgi:hypothetical protein